MARRITLTAPLHEPRQDFVEKLESASNDHAEALIDGYELLQQLHDRGVFAILRGALAAGDALMNTATDAVDSPQVIAGMRNLVVLGKALGQIDPVMVRGFAKAADETMSRKTPAVEPPSLVSLLGQFRQPEVRRGLELVSHFLRALGHETESAQLASRNHRAS